jgi:poly-gamma-glutamate system protein
MMNRKITTSTLVALLLFATALFLFIQRFCITSVERFDRSSMQSAVGLTTRWFQIIDREKKERGIHPSDGVHGVYQGLLGDEYSELTTTLGSVEAKSTAANPEFSALIVRMLHDAGLDSTCTVGVMLSGSFPSLSIAVLAACQTVGVKVVMVSSLGASSFGANQPGATWIDQEGWLREKGGLRYSSAFVTFGAEGDTGGGLSDEGIAELRQAVERNHAKLVVPVSLHDAIAGRIDLFEENRIKLLLNIGGSQPAMGACVHSTTIPNGFHRTLRSCPDSDRGVLVRMAEAGVPVIHLLNIRDLALKNGISLIPSSDIRESILYKSENVSVLLVILAILSISVGIFFLSVPKYRKSS